MDKHQRLTVALTVSRFCTYNTKAAQRRHTTFVRHITPRHDSKQSSRRPEVTPQQPAA